MVFVGGAVMALSSLAGGFAESGAQLLAARIVEGFGFATLTVAGPKMLVAAADGSVRRFVLGIWGTYMPVGIAFSLVIATVLLEPLGWRALWFINTGLILLFLLAFAWGAAPGRLSMPTAGSTFDRAGVRVTLARPGPWLFGLCFAIFAVQWQALMAWLPTFLIETQGRSLAAAVLFTVLFVLATTVGSVASAWLMLRGVARWLLLGLTFTGMGVCAATLFAPFTPLTAKIPLAVCFALASGPLPAVCFEGGIAHAPSQAQVAMAGGFVAQGAALGPPLLAAVTEALGGWARRVVDHAGLVLRHRPRGGRRRMAGRRESRTGEGRGMTSCRPLARALVAAVIVSAFALAFGDAFAASISLSTRPIALDPTDRTVRDVGRLHFLGGLDLWSDEAAFGGLSGLSATADGRLTAVTDRGHWFTARIVRDRNGRLVDLVDAALGPLLDTKGRPAAGEWRDAEALERLPGGDWLVSFEGRHRVWRYAAETGGLQGRPAPFPTPKGIAAAPPNGGLEALTPLPDGRILMLAESLNRTGGSRAGWLVGQEIEPLGCRTARNFKPTDAALLPNGDVLVLSRHFKLARRVQGAARADFRQRHRRRCRAEGRAPRPLRTAAHRGQLRGRGRDPRRGRRNARLHPLRRQLQFLPAHAPAPLPPGWVMSQAQAFSSFCRAHRVPPKPARRLTSRSSSTPAISSCAGP